MRDDPKGSLGAAITMLVVVLLATLAIHALLQSAICDFGDACMDGAPGGLYFLWLIPVAYAVAVFGVGRRRVGSPPHTAWPWAIAAGLLALSALVVSCFGVLYS